jgi:hypothetical protein
VVNEINVSLVKSVYFGSANAKRCGQLWEAWNSLHRLRLLQQSNIVESYSLLEPDACAATDDNREMEALVYGEIVQMKPGPTERSS